MNSQTNAGALLEVEGLKKWFPVTAGFLSRSRGQLKAVDGLSFEIRKGETFGLVGESGCGKSTLARVILRLLDPTEGTVRFDGQAVTGLGRVGVRKLRRHMQIIFQDPYSSLNPRMTIGEIVEEPMVIYQAADKAGRVAKVRDLLQLIGLDKSYVRRYPHELSGGQRQRVSIARALALNPRFIVCDEPVSALDVSIRSQILNLLAESQDRFGLTYLFVSHDLSVVRHISDRVGAMYLGKLIEVAGKDELYEHPLHPYTLALLSAIPVPDPEAEVKRIILEGDVPSPIDPPAGCRFRTRCRQVMERCAVEEPELREVGSGHQVACHLYSS